MISKEVKGLNHVSAAKLEPEPNCSDLNCLLHYNMLHLPEYLNYLVLHYKYDSITPLFKFLMSHLKFLCVFFEPNIQSYEMEGELSERGIF